VKVLEPVVEEADRDLVPAPFISRPVSTM
jgi:hypothetical protein